MINLKSLKPFVLPHAYKSLICCLLLQFLSMKLATVNPELYNDVEKIQSKDVSKVYVVKEFQHNFHVCFFE
jgi:hypothetical protein